MSIMPIDLRQHTFGRAMRGYDPEEVTSFLNQAADSYEQARRELDQLRQALSDARAQLAEHQEREATLRNTMLTAQRMTDQMHDAAQQEARIIVREAESRAALVVREAESRAALVVEKAQARLEEIEREISELRMRRRDVEGALEGIMTSLQHALEFVRAQDRNERDEKILLHRPRQLDADRDEPDSGAEPERHAQPRQQ
jgi:cell division initiation protein